MTDNDNNRTVPNALPVGYRFNEFEIKEVIGGGGFGIVYRAWDHQLERTIAIKEFMPSSLAVRGEDMTLVLRSERFGKAFSAGLNSFIQEARLLARFNHPNLLHVLRFWVQNDTAYMGTLFYSGTTLSRLREEKPELINEAWIRRMLPMLFGAIKTIHDEGYLHRDISLDNIQIQDNGLVISRMRRKPCCVRGSRLSSSIPTTMKASRGRGRISTRSAPYCAPSSWALRHRSVWCARFRTPANRWWS